MLAFAGNSILCRAALDRTGIDPGSFTAIRLVSGAVMLWTLVQLRHRPRTPMGSWSSAAALFAYAVAFSFAYVRIPASTGALLLFAAVQTTMIGYGIRSGERFRPVQIAGLTLAVSGLIALLLPGLTAPPLPPALLMIGAGVAWGVYSLRGRDALDPTGVTAGNFACSIPMAAALVALMSRQLSWSGAGAIYAAASGAIASGLGYAAWYSVVPLLRATRAAVVQLSVPVIAALGGMAILGEPISIRFAVTSAAILGGIAMVTLERPRRGDSG